MFRQHTSASTLAGPTQTPAAAFARRAPKANHSFRMQVGRTGHLHVEPLGFREYLIAHERKGPVLPTLGE